MYYIDGDKTTTSKRFPKVVLRKDTGWLTAILEFTASFKIISVLPNALQKILAQFINQMVLPTFYHACIQALV